MLWPWTMFKVTERSMNRENSVGGTIMQGLTFITFMMSELIPMSNFWQAQTLGQQQQTNVLIISLDYTPESHKSYLALSFLMCVATKEHLNRRGQESKTCNLQFFVLTHLWPWNKGYNHAKFEGSCCNGVW